MPDIDTSKLTDEQLEALTAEATRRRQLKREELNRKRPQVTEVLLTEGGQWIIWAPNALRVDPEQEKKGNYHAIHALKFADGSIWDVANGWRT
jgi:hypothetical protein